jgi:hypothetical protein
MSFSEIKDTAIDLPIMYHIYNDIRCLPNDIKRCILWNYDLGIMDIKSCILSNKIFLDILDDFQLNIFKIASKGWIKSIESANLKAIDLVWQSRQISKKPIKLESLYTKSKYYCNRNVFEVSCWLGHLNVARWLWDKSIELGRPLNIHGRNDYPFEISCINGDLDIAQWLYDLGIEINQPFNIHNLYDQNMRSCLDNKQIKSVRWLYKLGIQTNNPYPNTFIATYLWRVWRIQEYNLDDIIQ